MTNTSIEIAYNRFTEEFCKFYELNRNKTGPRLINNYEMHKAVDSAEKTIKYDPSYLTALSHLEVKWREGLKDIKYSLDTIAFNPAALKKEMDIILSMQAILDTCSEYQSQKRYFIDLVGNLLGHYEANEPFTVTEILEHRYSVLCSFDTLREFQFLRGQEDETEPKYIKQVYEWWNINSLIDFSTTLPNSISLHLIRHPNRYESYFCFLIKRGGNIFIFTDKMNLPTPLFDMTSRRPDRLMAENMSQNAFPYYLMNLESELGELFEYDEDDTKSIVPFQKQTHILTTISQLRRDSLLWVVLMFDLIHQNYFLNAKQLDELSYTVEMLSKPERFIEKATKNGIVVHSGTQKLEHISVSSVHSGNVDRTALGNEFTSNWMEDRYGHLITDEMLNQVNALGQNTYLQIADSTLITTEKSINDLVGFHEEDTLLSLRSIPSTAFNTGDQLRKDRTYIARYNYVKCLEKFAKQEFKERKPEIEQWFKKLCHSKIDLILQRCSELKSKYVIEDTKFKRIDDLGDCFSESMFMAGRQNAKAVMRPRDDIYKTINTTARFTLHGESGYNRCYFTDAQASYAAIFMMNNIDDILSFFNITLKQVPDILHHYTSKEYRSQGNSILNKTDPMADISNPFRRYEFPVVVYISKRAYNKLNVD